MGAVEVALGDDTRAEPRQAITRRGRDLFGSQGKRHFPVSFDAHRKFQHAQRGLDDDAFPTSLCDRARDKIAVAHERGDEACHGLQIDPAGGP